MATITEDYVSFKTAKLLKEKGFPQNPNMCNTAYTTKGKFSNNANSFAFYYELFKPRRYSIAPTLQMAMKWLREVHKLHIEILASYHFRIFDGYSFEVYNIKDAEFVNYYSDKGTFKTYEEAAESSIKYCLENLI